MKMTFIVPLVGIGDDLERARTCLLPSFNKFFRLADLHELIILAPEKEMEIIKETLFFEPALSDLRYKLTFIEDEYLRGFFNIHQTGGYNNQMLLKLLAHEIVATPIYGVCDADCYLVAPCGYAELVPEGRCLRQYAIVSYHPEWWTAACRVLDYRDPLPSTLFDVTPALLYKKISKELVDYLKTKNILDDTLCIWKNITEYTLYWVWILQHHRHAELYHDRGAPEMYGDCAWFNANLARLPALVEKQFSGHGRYYFSVLQSNLKILPPDYLKERFR